MCGIVGFVGQQTADLSRELLDRLATLEYRGYDSAGVVTHDERRGWHLVKAVGGLQKLREKLPKNPAPAALGLAHTRWATHGSASERNALPIASPDGRAFIVFNGIVENDFDLRRKLADLGIAFATDNDAETLLQWIMQHEDLTTALASVQGRYAFCLVFADEPGTILAVRRGSPLVIGQSALGYFVASDASAFASDTDRICYLNDQVIARLTATAFDIQGADGKETPLFQPMPKAESMALQSSYETYTEQEIFAQPDSIDRAMGSIARQNPELRGLVKNIDHVLLVGCGSAYHAACIGESLIQEHAGILAKAVIASEFRTGHQPLNARTLVVALSQSGETADTLASLERAQKMGAPTVVIGNVPGSSMARIADIFLPISCGLEIGVASTKAFVGMLVQVAFLSLTWSSEDLWADHVQAAEQLPMQIDSILSQRKKLERMARSLREKRNFLFVGRDLFLPIAYEGALKLRELTYRHAEGIGAGELKHGTLALIEPQYPVVAIAPKTRHAGKMISSLQEIRARGGQIWGIGSEGDADFAKVCHEVISLPATLPAFQPILATVPLQLFAYEFARTLGRNIDRPRNLAKSVTVE